MIANSAKKELKALPKAEQKKIVDTLEVLGITPRPSGAEKLRANPAFMRLRCGDYRVIYAVRDRERCCVVVLIRNRRDAFKGLSSLDAKLAHTLTAVTDKFLESAAVRGSA